MRPVIVTLALLAIGTAAHAQVPVSATCKDGTSFSGPSRRGACAGHGGVQTYAATGIVNPTAGAPTTAPGAPSTPPGPTAPGPAASAQAPTASYTTGQVWVNTATKVYHCPGSRY